MEVRVLGAHNQGTRDTRLVAVLIDGVLSLDAGSLASTLTLEEQRLVQGVLLSHRHYDHLRDLPLLAFNTFDCGATLPVYGLADTLDHLRDHLLSGALYPDFTSRPTPEAPRVRLVPVTVMQPFHLNEYRIVAVPVPHGVPAVGYQVTSPHGRKLFFTGDTGQGLASVWENIAPDLLLVEVTVPNRLGELARRQGHLTPALLRDELEVLAQQQRWLPPVVVLHMTPALEGELRQELEAAAKALRAEITPACEGLTVRV